MADPIITIALGLTAGIVFGLNGYFTKHDPGEKFNYLKITRTVVVFGAAGVIVAVTGDPITQANITAATGLTVVLGKIVDEWWSYLVREA